MKETLAALIILVGTAGVLLGQSTVSKAPNALEQQIIELEKKWSDAIQRQDEVQVKQFLADSYFLAVGVQGQPLQTFPREVWLGNLKFYKTHSFSIDDIKVNVYGDTAVVVMLYTQKATVGRPPRDRSAQFLITDIWVKQNDGWRVAERHSSRPEQPPPSGSAQ